MLDALLKDLRRQDYGGDVQIVVVEETDDPRPVEGVDYVPHPVRNLGIAHARNLALDRARHDLIVFVDDDCRVAPDWLGRLLAPLLEDDAVLGAQGGVTVPEGTNAIGWAESLLGFPGGGVARIIRSAGQAQDTVEVSTLNAAYRKQAVREAGGFDEAARWGGEDYLLAKRVATRGRLAFVPKATVRHAARGSLAAIWRWFARRGRAEVLLWRSGLAPGGYAGFLLRSSLLLKLALLLVLAPWAGWWLPLLLPVAVACATWWRLAWAWREAGVPKRAVLVAPLVRLVMDAATDWGRAQALLAGAF
jgi:GT2 family glycosyltransferase